MTFLLYRRNSANDHDLNPPEITNYPMRLKWIQLVPTTLGSLLQKQCWCKNRVRSFILTISIGFATLATTDSTVTKIQYCVILKYEL